MHNKYLITFEKVAATESFYIWRLNFSQGAVYQKMLNAYVNAVNIVRHLLLYFCVLQFVLPSGKCYCTNGMCDSKSLSLKTDTKHNSFLDGYVFETLNVSSWKECFYVCARKCVCHSFNFNELKKNWKLWVEWWNFKTGPELTKGKEWWDVLRNREVILRPKGKR